MARFVRTQQIAHRIGPGGRLALKVTDADTVVRGVADEEARVRATFEIEASSESEADALLDAAGLRVGRGDGWLEVEQRNEGSTLGALVGRLLRGHPTLALELQVDLPQEAELGFDGVSGDLHATGLLGDQRYATVSGDLYLDDAAGSVRVNSVSGDTTIRAGGALDLRSNAVSGDLSVSAPHLTGLRSTSVSGDLEVEGRLDPAGDHRAETVSGDLTIGLVGAATLEVRGISTDISSDLDHRVEGHQDRRRVIIGSGGPLLVFSSMSGDLAIRRPRRIMDERPATPAAAAAQLDVLRALERGEIDVDEAARRLAGRSR
jgi:hypothetical protein